MLIQLWTSNPKLQVSGVFTLPSDGAVCRGEIRHSCVIPGEQINPVLQDEALNTNTNKHNKHGVAPSQHSVKFTINYTTTKHRLGPLPQQPLARAIVTDLSQQYDVVDVTVGIFKFRTNQRQMSPVGVTETENKIHHC
ncbi:hypothetical protein C0J52_27707 [Blattella germanica]|nr:hypothetical protein C0J52_27707 [Blattella germanica]